MTWKSSKLLSSTFCHWKCHFYGVVCSAVAKGSCGGGGIGTAIFLILVWDYPGCYKWLQGMERKAT